MTYALCATPIGSGNPIHILRESPDAIRLSGPIWTCSGLTLQAPCKLYAGDHWTTGTITATGVSYALVKTADGTSRCTDRRNILNKEEAILFKRARAAWQRQSKKLAKGRTNG